MLPHRSFSIPEDLIDAVMKVTANANYFWPCVRIRQKRWQWCGCWYLILASLCSVSRNNKENHSVRYLLPQYCHLCSFLWKYNRESSQKKRNLQFHHYRFCLFWQIFQKNERFLQVFREKCLEEKVFYPFHARKARIFPNLSTIARNSKFRSVNRGQRCSSSGQA